jgi:hypothetical protein
MFTVVTISNTVCTHGRMGASEFEIISVRLRLNSYVAFAADTTAVARDGINSSFTGGCRVEIAEFLADSNYAGVFAVPGDTFTVSGTGADGYRDVVVPVTRFENKVAGVYQNRINISHN